MAKHVRSFRRGGWSVFVIRNLENGLMLGPYTVRISVYGSRPDDTVDFGGRGQTLRDAFSDVRSEICRYRKACRKLPVH